MARTPREADTRRRLLAAGARLFAARGYAHVTIRDICGAAHANIAAVNYHFAGKSGLYAAVVQQSIAAMREVTDRAISAGASRSAEERLRAYVSVFLERVTTDELGWVHQLLLHELSEPTDALDRILDDVMEPRLQYLKGIVAELLGCTPDDPRATRCAFSIHAQCHAMMTPSLVTRMTPGSEMHIPAMADHITEFSLAGLWALARRV